MEVIVNGIHASVSWDKGNLDRGRPESKYLISCSFGVAIHVDQDMDAICIDSVCSHSIVGNLRRIRRREKVCIENTSCACCILASLGGQILLHLPLQANTHLK